MNIPGALVNPKVNDQPYTSVKGEGHVHRLRGNSREINKGTIKMIGHIGTGKKHYTFLNAVKEVEYLKANPVCACCQREGKYKKATVVWIFTNGEKEPRCDEHAKGKVL